jgi:tripartite-type tricarboxylate transporter receptor subunit TctC
VRLLAVTGAKRMAQHPDVPTVDELGIPEMVVPIWFGYFAPARTPQPIVEFLHAEFMKALADPQFINSLREQAMEAFPADQKLADAPAFVAATVAQSKEIVARTGIRIEE